MISLIRRAWHYAGDQRWVMALYYGLFIIASIIYTMQPLVLDRIVKVIQAGGDNLLQQTLFWTGVLFTTILGVWAFHGPARVIERRLAFRIFKRFQLDLYQKVCSLPLRWHQNHHSGDTMNRVSKACTALFSFSQTQFLHIQLATRFVACVVFLAYYSWWIGLIVLVTSFFTVLTMKGFDRYLVRIVRERNELEHKLSSVVHDTIGNIISVLTLRLQKRTQVEIENKFETMRAPFWSETTYNETKWFVLSGINHLLMAVNIALYVGASLYKGEAVNLGGVVAIFQYQFIVMQTFFMAVTHIETLMRYEIDVSSVDPLLSAHHALYKDRVDYDIPAWQRIDVSDLCFTHHEGDEALHHLRHMNFSLNAGKKIALIGTSGSGKTTLLTLLRGLYDAGAVQMKIDGQSFDSLAPLASFTTLIPQDAEIFENTILYNITLGVETSDAVLREVLDISGFASVVERLPAGLLSDIRERGVNLSGGEKQRLALARGLFAARDSSLLLLDEPTSHVDLPTEKKIFDQLFQSFAGKTIVASIHRLHLLPRFDTIIFMKDGQVIVQGSFAQLLDNSEEFQRLWAHHLSTEDEHK